MKSAPSIVPAALVLASISWGHPVLAAPCQKDRDCSASSDTQLAWCQQQECVLAPRNQPQCRDSQTSPFCIVDANCDDARSDTVNWCEAYRCHRAPRDAMGQCSPEPCTRDPQCNDFDVSTQDWCRQGSCVHAQRSQSSCRRAGVSCTTRKDCIDGDPNTVDWCFEGTCAQIARSSAGQCEASGCAPVTVVLESTRRGAVNNPVLGGRWKVVGNSYQIRYQRGRTSNGPATLNYHCFDLQSVRGQILSANLEMVHSDNSYQSEDPSETVVFRPMDRVPCDAALDVSILARPPNHQAIFDDLRDGSVVAQFTATLSDADQVERFAVNSSGLAQLRNLAGQATPWGIGGGLSSADAPQTGAIERVFRGTDDTGGTELAPAKLILQVRPSGCF